MNKLKISYPTDWFDYKLLDSGNGQKLEDFSGYRIIRPDPRAIWFPKKDLWEADATFDRNSKDGRWLYKRAAPKDWTLKYKNLRFKLKPTDFRHVGVFPEQAVNWDFLETKINSRPLRVLNLFGYTGGATIAASRAGAKVTHVDSSRGIISWAKENATLSNLASDAVRWIEDDAYKFVLREERRGNKYDGIILDPPRFGHGTSGEVWKLSDDLTKLLIAVKNILASDYKFLILNLYTADLSPIAVSQIMEDVFMKELETFELCLKEQNSERFLPNGIVCRSI